MKKVVIIEDSPTDAAIVKSVLDSHDIAVDIAPTGEEGLEKVFSSKPDLVILDVILPGIDGFQVCERLRKEKSLDKTIILILSSKNEAKYISRAFQAGADDYVIKISAPEFLANKIKLYLGVR